METILIHPTYFTSIVQMIAFVQAKNVIFEADDNYQKQSYRNRTYIAHSNGKLLLNIPIKHTQKGLRKKTNEVHVENSFPWQIQHWKSLESAYRTSPYFEYYEDELRPLFFKPVHSLFDFNLEGFDLICGLLEISKSYDFTEEYYKNPSQLDLRSLVRPKLDLAIKLDPYFQVLNTENDFIANLSILDLLFNEGPNTVSYLESQKIDFSQINPIQK